MATYPIKMLRDEDRQPFVPFTNAAAVVDSNSVTLQELMDNGKYKIQNNVTTSQAGKGVLDAYQGKVLNDKFSNYVPLSQKGVANGVATLDGDAKVPTAQLPSYVDDVIEAYIRSGATALSSTWLSLTDGGAALTPEKGKIYVIMSSGSYQNKQYRWGGSTYVLCNPSDVNSVNGFTGVVVLKELTIQKNGTQVGDKFNGSANKTINITVPTKTSDITNNSGFITAADDITGNAATATKLAAAKKINGTNFDGSSDITTANWGTSRNIGIVNSDGTGTAVTVAVNGSQAVNLKLPATIKANLTGNADTATKATQDGSGNVITNTYVKKAGDTMTGDLKFASGKDLIWDDATYRQKIHVIDDSIANTAVFEFQQSTDSGSTWPTLMTIKDNGEVVATKFTGSLNGTAAKATADGSGNNIVNTYSTKANTISGLSVSGKVITYTKADGTTGTITTQDTVYTLPVAGIGINGVLGGIKVGSGLTIDSTTGVLSATGGGTADSVEWSGVLNKPTNISYWTNDSGYITLANVMSGATASTAGTAGVVPAPGSGSQAKFLRGDGKWAEVSTADTKNTTGTTNTTSKIYLAGATEQSANPQTYSNVNCYASGGKLYSNAKEVVNLSDTQALTNKTYNGYTLAAASAKAVDTSISAASTSTNLPTSAAVAAFVEGKGYVTTDTTYSAGTGIDITNTVVKNTGVVNVEASPSAAGNGTIAITKGTATGTQTSYVAVKGLSNAAYKDVDTSISAASTSTKLPTSQAVAAFVEGKGYVTTDTKNTAGSTDTSSKIFLVGATSQAANPQTYSDNEVYVTSGVLTTKSVQVGGTAATIQYNSTDKCIEFVFA